VGRFFQHIINWPAPPPQRKGSVGTQLLYDNVRLLLQHRRPSLHVDLKHIQKNLFIFGGTPADDHLEGFIDLDSLGPFVHQEKVIDEVFKFFEVLIGLPEIPLEDDEGLAVVGYLNAGNDVLHGLEPGDAQLDHIEDFVLVGSANDDVVGPFLIVGAKHEQRSVCLLA
jgi:hypothetical protein